LARRARQESRSRQGQPRRSDPSDPHGSKLNPARRAGVSRQCYGQGPR
jgi:hypothetical protein